MDEKEIVAEAATSTTTQQDNAAVITSEQGTHKKNSAERSQFFKELYQHCSDEDVYSVIETAEGMGVSYEQVKEWADKNKKLNHILQECRALCAKRAEDKLDGLHKSKDMNWDEYHAEYDKAMKYHEENDDKFAQMRAESMAQCVAQREREEKEEKDKKEKEEAAQKELRKSVGLRLTYSDNWPQKKKVETQNADNFPVPTESEKRNWVTQWREQRISIDEQRLKVWREKHAKENPGFYIKKNDKKSTDESIYLEPAFYNPDISAEEKDLLVGANLCAETGAADFYLSATMLTETIGAIHKKSYQDVAMLATTTHAALLAMAPTDVIDGMLCSRMWALHNQSMYYMNLAAGVDTTTEGCDLNINRATKLMRLYNETLDARNKHQRKGEQKVVVQHQHVSVNDGGQAVISGQVNQGGGGQDKK
jgi:hypothetical protein